MDAAPTENPIIMNVMSVYGYMVIGGAISCALWGIGCMQMFLYFLNYEEDHLWMKALVVYIWMLDTVIEALLFAGIFPPLITQWGSVASYATVQPALVIRTLLSYVLAVPVQLFFHYRIYRFTGKSKVAHVCVVLIGIVVMWQLVGVSLFTAWSLPKHQPVATALSTPRVVASEISSRASASFIDVTIAVWMTFLLAKRRKALFVRSNRMLYLLMFMTINTGLWTAVVAVLDFSLIAWHPSHLIFTLFEYPLPALYLNMLLANLNARRYLRGADGGITELRVAGLDGSGGNPIRLNSGDTSGRDGAIPLRAMNASATLAHSQDGTVAIRIEKSLVTRSDAESLNASADSKV
ncbi:hypothetical protein PsYK624_067460 [Phanerochaete sordida]|uniref:DUF6534 domain-containing protein n=1 Tax=Phanerochaete sordida TaxID=48140 RepID=A0A9P3G9N4_9APHY|nr:hypothetical protein PsYK624_067460 [Phanerochaete sordida]